MQRQRYRRRNPLYLFNLTHREFVDGDVDKFPTAMTRKFAIQQFVYLFLIVALPMVILITTMVGWAGYRVEFLIPVEFFTAVISCAYFVVKDYLKDKILRDRGTILYGEVIRKDKLPGFKNIGASTVTRIFYRFAKPEQEAIIAYIDFSYQRHSLPDGRKYPETGTSVAILYANDKNHKLL